MVSRPSEVPLLQSKVENAAEWFIAGTRSNLVLTCDHASLRLPSPWKWPREDLDLMGTHWCYDLGAAALTRNLALRLQCKAALSRFTRLLIDPNRHRQAKDLVRMSTDTAEIHLNREVNAAQLQHRLEHLYDAYHHRVSDLIEATPHAALLSIHTFTPQLDEEIRAMEIGVLFNRYDELAHQFAKELSHLGWKVALNAPYSGFDGLVYGVERHGVQHDRTYLELEIRQDIACHPDGAQAVSQSIAQVASRLFPTRG